MGVTSTDVGPQLLPGISASAWQSVLRVCFGIAAAAMVATSAITIFRRTSGVNFTWFIPVFVAYGLVYVGALVLSVRTKKEVAAGYTTLGRANPTLPQLNAKTGEIVRKAGEPYLERVRSSVRMASE